MFSEIARNKYYGLMVILATENPSEIKKHKARELLRDIDLNMLFLCACEHDMESVIYPKLKELYPGSLPTAWDNRYIETKKRIEFMVLKLTQVADRLDEVGVPIVALKNGGISTAIMDDYGKCPMGDIDTLVNKGDFMKAHMILTNMGFTFKFRSEFEFEDIQQAFIDGGTEYFYIDKDDSSKQMWFELSWRAISGRWIRPDKEPDTEVLIADSKFIKDYKIRILSPEDNLLQVAIHTAKHSYVREPGFRLHLDVERIVKHLNIDWDLFLKKVEEVGTKTAVYYSLYISKQLYDTPIPDYILEKLRPCRRKDEYFHRALKKAQLLHPVENKFSKIEFIVFQLMLYDKFSDVLNMIFPSIYWLKERYDFRLSVLYPYYVIVRMLDLVGIRKRK